MTNCHYTKPANQCGGAEWVIAFMCDHCEANNTMEVCDQHYHTVYMDETMRLSCGNCQGTLSWMSERIDHTAQTEVIN